MNSLLWTLLEIFRHDIVFASLWIIDKEAFTFCWEITAYCRYILQKKNRYQLSSAFFWWERENVSCSTIKPILFSTFWLRAFSLSVSEISTRGKVEMLFSISLAGLLETKFICSCCVFTLNKFSRWRAPAMSPFKTISNSSPSEWNEKLVLVVTNIIEDRKPSETFFYLDFRLCAFDI